MKTKRSFDALTSSKPHDGDRYELRIITPEEEKVLNQEAAVREEQRKREAAEDAKQDEQLR